MTQDLNKKKKNLNHPIVDIGKYETCAKFQQKILNPRVVGARQSFQIFEQNTIFLQKKELCLIFFMGLCIT